MSPAVSLLAFFIFSFGVGLSGQLYAAFFAPPMLLFALKISIAHAVCTRLAVLNIFAILSALSPAIVGNYELAGVIFLRANLIMAFAILLFYGKDEYFFARGFYGLGLGEKLSSLVYCCGRFVNFLRSDLARLQALLRMRGFVGTSGIFTYKIYANLVGILAISALEQARNLSLVMSARGFCGRLFYERREALSVSEASFLAFVLACVFIKIGAIL